MRLSPSVSLGNLAKMDREDTDITKEHAKKCMARRLLCPAKNSSHSSKCSKCNCTLMATLVGTPVHVLMDVNSVMVTMAWWIGLSISDSARLVRDGRYGVKTISRYFLVFIALTISVMI